MIFSGSLEPEPLGPWLLDLWNMSPWAPGKGTWAPALGPLDPKPSSARENSGDPANIYKQIWKKLNGFFRISGT